MGKADSIAFTSRDEASTAVVEQLPHEDEEVRPNYEASLEVGTKKWKRGEVLPSGAKEVLPCGADEVLPSGDNEVVEYAHLCTFFCDFLIEFSSSEWIAWNSSLPIEVECALEHCEPNHCDDSDDTYLMEFRGLFKSDIGPTLLYQLSYVSRTSMKYLHCIVGCKAHGIGKGLLRNVVCNLLHTDKISYECLNDDSIVSIEIDKGKDYSFFPLCLTVCKQPQIVAEHSQENEPVSSFSPEVNKMSSDRNEKGPIASFSPINEPVSSFYPEVSKMSSDRNEKGPIASSSYMDTIIFEPGSSFSLCDGNKDHDKPSAATSDGSYVDQVPPLNALENTSVGSYLDQVPPLNALENVKDVEDFCEDFFLCTVVCDFLAGLENRFRDCWKRTIPKVLAGLKESCFGLGNDDGGSCTIDLRGQFADEAKMKLIDRLNKPSHQYLKVIVGCKLHGVGSGKLRKIVCELLDLNGLKSSSDCNDSIITIQLDGRQDYTSHRYISQPLLDFSEDVSEDSDDIGFPVWAASKPLDDDVLRSETLVEIYKSSKEGNSLCTFVCDFLSDLPTPPGQWWDKKTTLKVLAGLGKCCKSASVENVDGTFSVDVRGQYVDEAIKDILNILRTKPAQKYLHLIVGCKVHGIGNGKLRNAMSCVLADCEIKCVPDTEPYVISIEVDTVDMLLIDNMMMSGRKDPHVSGIDSGDHSEISEVLDPHGSGIDSGDHSEISEVFLCTILCDLLFDNPEQYLLLDEGWNGKLVVQVLGALDLCDTYFCTKEDLQEGTYAIDLRGQPGRVSEIVLINNLICWSSYFKRLKFIVGCTRHGIGEGKLKDMVSGVLRRDSTIKWQLVEQAIISVELDPEKDYCLLNQI